MIKLENIYIQYVNEFYSLYNFSYTINYHTLFIGDFFNGSNAIMRILSKIDNHYKGKVLVDNVDIKSIKNKDLNISYLPQQPVLFKNKNIFKNLYFPLFLRKINKNTAKNLINNIFFELNNKNFNFLSNYLNKKNNNIFNIKIKKLNISEQKIIALIRTLLRKPKYILLENFFEDFNETYYPIAHYLIYELSKTSTLIACEKDNTILNKFVSLNVVNLEELEQEKKEV